MLKIARRSGTKENGCVNEGVLAYAGKHHSPYEIYNPNAGKPLITQSSSC